MPVKDSNFEKLAKTFKFASERAQSYVEKLSKTHHLDLKSQKLRSLAPKTVNSKR